MSRRDAKVSRLVVAAIVACLPSSFFLNASGAASPGGDPLTTPRIVDCGSTGAVVRSWTVDSPAGLDGDQRVISGGAATDAATWTFTEVTPGSGRGSNASCTAIDNSNHEIDDVLATVTVNQHQAPADATGRSVRPASTGPRFSSEQTGQGVRRNLMLDRRNIVH
jgi:hypothetical protein